MKEILALYDRQQRIEIEYPGMRKEVLPKIVRFVRPAPGMSLILYSHFDEAAAEAVIQEQIDYFQRQRLPFEWKTYEHDNPADLWERLEAHGFECEAPDAIMVLDLEKIPEELRRPADADVHRLEQRQELEDVIQVEGKVWEEDFGWIQKRLGDHMEDPDYLSVYVAYVEGVPACTGWVYFHADSEFASLWGGSTVPGYRQRGLYTAILARRVQEAAARGFRYVTVDAGPMSRPILEKHGFQLLTYARACDWKAPDESKEP